MQDKRPSWARAQVPIAPRLSFYSPIIPLLCGTTRQVESRNFAPLPRKSDLAIDKAGLQSLVDDLRAGGISTFMWGGNANLYNMGVSEFAEFCGIAETMARGDEWVIPSIGADFGKAMDQAKILRGHKFPAAMMLPLRFPATPKGIAAGIGKIAESFGRPLILYIKDDGYIEPADAAALMRDGAVTVIKYGTVRDNPAKDDYLARLVSAVDPLRIISGIGERPVIEHFTVFGLRDFTSGCVCIAPGMSMMIREHLLAGRVAEARALRGHFAALEDERDRYSPLRVLHAAVELAGVAPTGPMQPMLANIDDPAALASIKAAAVELRGLELRHRQKAAAE